MKPKNSIDIARIHRLYDHDILEVAGWAFDEAGLPADVSLVVNGKTLDVEPAPIHRPDVARRYLHRSEGLSHCGFRFYIEDCEQVKKLEVRAGDETIFSAEKGKLKSLINDSTIVYHIDSILMDKRDNVTVTGWAYSLNHAETDILVRTKASGAVKRSSIRRIIRNDLYSTGVIRKDEKRSGFAITYKHEKGQTDVLVLSSDKDRPVEIQISDRQIRSASDSRLVRILKDVNGENIYKTLRYVKRYGLKQTVRKVLHYTNGADYDRWFRAHRVTEDTLAKQKTETFEIEPLISIIVPAYNTPPELLQQTIQSVEDQSYAHWQLCIAFAGESDAPAIGVLKDYQAKDDRITVRFLDENLGISGNTNAAYELANGDYIALFDHDDLLEPDALYEIVKAVNADKSQQAFYTDEDKYDTKQRIYIDPNLKPDFNIDLLRSHNYITHFFVVKKSVVDKIGFLRSDYDGAQDYDFILRVAEETGTIGHIPKILYHWRMISGSTALDPESKNYAYVSGEKAIRDHLMRCGIKAKVRMQEKPYYGLYEVDYKPVSNPLISIIIEKGKKKHPETLRSIKKVNTYDNYEIVDTVSEAKGELLLFLKDGLEIITPDSIKNMAGFFERSDVGAIGAKILYADDSVEHAGIITMQNGFVEYVNAGIDRTQPGYMMRALLNCDYSAVSGDCLMTRRSLFGELVGFDESYESQCAGIDYCMRVRKKGLLVVYNAFSLWYDYGDYSDVPDADRNLFIRKFRKELSVCDPYYNPQFTIGGEPFVLESAGNDDGESFRDFCARAVRHVRNKGRNELIYQKWIEQTEASADDLKKERQEYDSLQKDDLPLFTIVVPVYKTPEKYLKALIDSVRYQTYEKWELVLADAGADENGKSINTDMIRKIDDERIRYFVLESNAGISANTNEAIKHASGDWIVFADHDDTLAASALFKAYLSIEKHPDAGYIYTDEDKIDETGKKRSGPNFKPDFNVDLLNSTNYISHLSIVRKDILDAAGYLNPEYDGSQDYDLTLRCIEQLRPDQVIHIPEVMYHWRISENSTAGDQENKLYAYDAGRRAVQAHLDRTGIPGTVEELQWHGLYRIHYHWSDHPKVSVIIPNKDHVEDLRRCIDSILEKTTYPDYEIIVAENNSTTREIEDYYDQIQSDNRIKVIRYQGGFNYSDINNTGVAQASGEYYLFLNNDTEVISPDWMTEMVDVCQRSDVGIVGAKLYYPDDTIQHAGVILGLGGPAGHIYRAFPKSDPGFMGRLVVCQDFSAVTAACMVVKKEAFEKADGFSTDLAVAYNDVDLCLKVGKVGYRVVFTPFAELYHYESKSRGSDETDTPQERFLHEKEVFMERWGNLVDSGDPAYNKHFTLKRSDCSFNEDLRRTIEK